MSKKDTYEQLWEALEDAMSMDGYDTRCGPSSHIKAFLEETAEAIYEAECDANCE